jgi:hypothetical protein
MNELLKSIPWRQHGWSFLFGALALIAFVISYLVHNNAQENLVSTQKRYQQQQSINFEAEHSAAVLAEFLPQYRELQKQGVIAQPQRLQWLETLQKNADADLIPMVRFTLSPSIIATTTETSYASDTLQLKVTPMQISFTLLHEMDFYRLMHAMQTESKGVFSTQDCVIERNEGENITERSNDSVDTSNPETLDSFKGQCNLLWYSLADLTKAWEETPQ